MLSMLAFIWVMICWAGVGITMAFRFTKKRTETVQTRNTQSLIGFLLEALGFACVFIHRDLFTVIVFTSWMTILFPIFASWLATWSVLLIYRAIRELGKQWAVSARIIEGHKLVTTGPYAIVRNPIYSGLFGMLIAIGLVIAHWQLLLLGIVLYWVGTTIRIKAEEKLLFASFDSQFADYVAKVPALIPQRLFAR